MLNVSPKLDSAEEREIFKLLGCVLSLAIRPAASQIVLFDQYMSKAWLKYFYS